MSKSALGRGLGSLLKSEPPPASAADAAPNLNASPNGGVNLLLRGRDEEEMTPVSAAPTHAWLSPALLGFDAVLVLAGCLLLFSHTPITRLVAGILLVAVAASIGIVLVLLNHRPAPRQAAFSPGPKANGQAPEPQPAKVRVHFVDELPRQRRN